MSDFQDVNHDSATQNNCPGGNIHLEELSRFLNTTCDLRSEATPHISENDQAMLDEMAADDTSNADHNEARKDTTTNDPDHGQPFEDPERLFIDPRLRLRLFSSSGGLETCEDIPISDHVLPSGSSSMIHESQKTANDYDHTSPHDASPLDDFMALECPLCHELNNAHEPGCLCVETLVTNSEPPVSQDGYGQSDAVRSARGDETQTARLSSLGAFLDLSPCHHSDSSISRQINVVILSIGPTSDGTGATPAKQMRRNDGFFLRKLAERWANDIESTEPWFTYILDRLPDGYGGYECVREGTHHVDRYLYGHPKGNFRSSDEFYPHFKYLQDHNDPLGCPCNLCLGTSDETLQQRMSVQEGIQLESQSASGSPSVQGESVTEEASTLPRYQGSIDSFQAAHNTVALRDIVEEKIRIDSQHDDWKSVKTDSLQHFTAQLFDSFTHEPGEPPEIFKDHEREYHHTHQAEKLRTILAQVQKDPVYAEARAMLMMELIIDIHEYGIPESVMKRTNLKQGYIPEIDQICSVRTEKVIDAVKHDKYCAYDVLFGVAGLPDFARSPSRYLMKKHQNNKVNAKKAFDKKQADRAMTEGGVSQEVEKTEGQMQQTRFGGANTLGKRRAPDSNGGVSNKRGRFDAV